MTISGFHLPGYSEINIDLMAIADRHHLLRFFAMGLTCTAAATLYGTKHGAHIQQAQPEKPSQQKVAAVEEETPESALVFFAKVTGGAVLLYSGAQTWLKAVTSPKLRRLMSIGGSLGVGMVYPLLSRSNSAIVEPSQSVAVVEPAGSAADPLDGNFEAELQAAQEAQEAAMVKAAQEAQEAAMVKAAEAASAHAAKEKKKFSPERHTAKVHTVQTAQVHSVESFKRTTAVPQQRAAASASFSSSPPAREHSAATAMDPASVGFEKRWADTEKASGKLLKVGQKHKSTNKTALVDPLDGAFEATQGDPTDGGFEAYLAAQGLDGDDDDDDEDF